MSYGLNVEMHKQVIVTLKIKNIKIILKIKIDQIIFL